MKQHVHFLFAACFSVFLMFALSACNMFVPASPPVRNRTESTGSTESEESTTTQDPEPLAPTEALEFALNEDGKSYSVIDKGSCSDKEIVIPATYQGLPVTAIREVAFTHCTDLTRLTISDNVTEIGFAAFEDCEALTEVILPASLKTIHERAFRKCTALKSISIPEGVTEIKEEAFCDCTNLRTVYLPESITTIGSAAFGGCLNIKKVSVTNIAKWCEIEFANLSSNPLTQSRALFLNDELVLELEIPDGVTNISNYAFAGCYTIRKVSVPPSITSVGDLSFAGCDHLSVYITDIEKWCAIDFGYFESISHKRNTEDIVNPFFQSPDNTLYLNEKQVTSIYVGGKTTDRISPIAFAGLQHLYRIDIGEGIHSIGYYAFANCPNLRVVDASEPYYQNTPVIQMGAGAFANCFLLEKVQMIIKSDNTFRLFLNCISLNKIVFPGTVADWESIKKDEEWNQNTGEYVVICSDGEIKKQ